MGMAMVMVTATVMVMGMGMGIQKIQAIIQKMKNQEDGQGFFPVSGKNKTCVMYYQYSFTL